MARIPINPQQPPRTGATITFVAANAPDGNSFSNNGRRHLRIKNTGAEATATVVFGGSKDGTALTQGKAIVVPATTGDITTAIFPPDDYNQPDNSVWINWSATPTGVTVAVVEV